MDGADQICLTLTRSSLVGSEAPRTLRLASHYTTGRFSFWNIAIQIPPNGLVEEAAQASAGTIRPKVRAAGKWCLPRLIDSRAAFNTSQPVCRHANYFGPTFLLDIMVGPLYIVGMAEVGKTFGG
jgi:hypothetical protein